MGNFKSATALESAVSCSETCLCSCSFYGGQCLFWMSYRTTAFWIFLNIFFKRHSRCFMCILTFIFIISLTWAAKYFCSLISYFALLSSQTLLLRRLCCTVDITRALELPIIQWKCRSLPLVSVWPWARDSLFEFWIPHPQIGDNICLDLCF